jgi:hypothetical protein
VTQTLPEVFYFFDFFPLSQYSAITFGDAKVGVTTSSLDTTCQGIATGGPDRFLFNKEFEC